MGRLMTDNSYNRLRTAAKFRNLTAQGVVTVLNKAGTLQKIVLNTNGMTVLVRNGSEVIANIALDAPEGVFEYGIWCNSSIVVELGGNGDVTVVYG